MAEDRVTIQEAARRLGVKEDAIRKRVRRGTLRSEKGEDGRVYVWVDAAHAEAQVEEKTTQDETQADVRDALVESLQDQVEDLRARLDRRDRELESERETRTEERRRADAVIAQLSQANSEQARTIREIEAPNASPEPQNEPESAESRSDRVGTPQEPETGAQRPWWRRVFGG